jgi:hypothetical protein
MDENFHLNEIAHNPTASNISQYYHGAQTRSEALHLTMLDDVGSTCWLASFQ